MRRATEVRAELRDLGSSSHPGVPFPGTPDAGQVEWARRQETGRMPEVQEVEVFIRPDGSVELKVRGVKGPRCREITAGLERALGGAAISFEPTAEYHDVPLDERDRPHLQDGVGDGR